MADRNLQGKVAIVTGGAGGVGAATVARLAEAGAAVVVADIAAEAAERTAGALAARGLAAAAVVADLSREDECVRLVEETVSRFGRLDILHNNAANTADEIYGRDLALLEMTAEIWDATFAVNVRAPMLLSRQAIPHMARNGGGVIVNTSTGASEQPTADARTAYGPSKAALNALTKYVAAQYGRQNIRCNALICGLVLTPKLHAFYSQEVIDGLAASTVLQRGTTPEDVAAVVHFLVSDDARQITGELLHVHAGGRLL